MTVSELSGLKKVTNELNPCKQSGTMNGCNAEGPETPRNE